MGFCFEAVVEQAVEDHQAAVEQVRQQLRQFDDGFTDLDFSGTPFKAVCVYVNPDKVTVADIVFVVCDD